MRTHCLRTSPLPEPIGKLPVISSLTRNNAHIFASKRRIWLKSGTSWSILQFALFYELQYSRHLYDRQFPRAGIIRPRSGSRSQNSTPKCWRQVAESARRGCGSRARPHPRIGAVALEHHACPTRRRGRKCVCPFTAVIRKPSVGSLRPQRPFRSPRRGW